MMRFGTTLKIMIRLTTLIFPMHKVPTWMVRSISENHCYQHQTQEVMKETLVDVCFIGELDHRKRKRPQFVLARMIAISQFVAKIVTNTDMTDAHWLLLSLHSREIQTHSVTPNCLVWSVIKDTIYCTTLVILWYAILLRMVSLDDTMYLRY